MAYQNSSEFYESAHLYSPNKRIDRIVFAGIATALAGVAFVGIQDAHFNDSPQPQGEVAMAVEPGETHSQVFVDAFGQIQKTTKHTPSNSCVQDGLEALNNYEETWIVKDGTFVPVIKEGVTTILRPEIC